MSGSSGKPIWLRLLFIVIGLLLIVKMVAQDLLPHFGEECKGVNIQVEQKQYYEKNNQNKNSRAIKKTKWHYYWTFYVDNKEYRGHVDLGEKSKKIGNTATVYYFAPCPWLNSIDTGTAFGISSIFGVLLGMFFLYLGLSRSKKVDPVPVFPPTGIVSGPVAQQKMQKIETRAQANVIPSNQLANQTNIQTKPSDSHNDDNKINFCPNCGSKVFEGAGFCANCGKKLV